MTGKIARFDRVALRGVLIAAALVAAGCTRGGSSQTTDLQPGGETGYRWVGAGEQGNFASAYSFCRENMRLQDFGSLGPGGGNRSGAGSSTYNQPDVNFTGLGSRGGYSTRRSFDSCMRSQGWAIVEQGVQPTAPQQPLPSTATPRGQL